MKALRDWGDIVRMGLVQSALGAVVVLTTSTINRVMVVELSVAATLPGALVALHYVVQILRPRLGYGADRGGRRTPWIVGGVAVLALGGLGSALATALSSPSVSASARRAPRCSRCLRCRFRRNAARPPPPCCGP